MSGEPRDPWDQPTVVAGFSESPPNDALMQLANREQARVPAGRALDIGCGAGRNAVPLANTGWRVFGIDKSRAMLDTARRRGMMPRIRGALHLAEAHMAHIPGRDGLFDLIVAHGVWNLASSSAEFRQAVREAARLAAPNAALFVFSQFSGRRQCFLTEDELITEMRDGGFVVDATWPMRELNRPIAGALPTLNAPVTWEAVFRRV